MESDVSTAAPGAEPATEALPPLQLDTLLLGLAPLAPEAGSAGRIKRRVLARMAMAATDDQRWGPLGVGLAYRVLHDDGRTLG